MRNATFAPKLRKSRKRKSVVPMKNGRIPAVCASRLIWSWTPQARAIGCFGKGNSPVFNLGAKTLRKAIPAQKEINVNPSRRGEETRTPIQPTLASA